MKKSFFLRYDVLTLRKKLAFFSFNSNMENDSTILGAPLITPDNLEAFVAPSPNHQFEAFAFEPSCWSRGLSPALVLEGYRQGAFPWPDRTAEVSGLYPWGRLFPCTLLQTAKLRLTHSMKKRVKAALRHQYQSLSLEILLDDDFDAVIEEIALYHEERNKGTWLTQELIDTWKTLHRMGHAHTVSVYVDDVLVGGLYFTSVGRMVYGESMFSRATDTSKLALAALGAFCACVNLPLIDCQMPSEHTVRLGAQIFSGDYFLTINRALSQTADFNWHRAKGISLIPFMEKRWPELAPASDNIENELSHVRHITQAGGLLFETIRIQSECNYFDDRSSTMEVIPLASFDPRVKRMYNRLIPEGFRRDSTYLYRLRCANCRRCIPTRLDVTQFHPDATMRRTLNRNRNLIMNEVSLAPINDEQWALYQRYQNGRHEGGSMSKMTREQVNSVLFATCTDSRFLEFRTSSDSENPNELKMVCIIDRLDDALSAVYTFYDPDAPKLSLGTFGILSEIEYAQQNGLRYVYLGYWLPDYPNMDYKKRFQPMEILWSGQWIPERTFVADPNLLEHQPS